MKILQYLIIIFSVTLTILLTSCNPKKHYFEDADLTVIKFEEAPDSFRLTDSFRDISCIQLEMTDESLVGNVKRIVDVSGQLVVLAENEIFVFNKEDGKFIRKLGSIGEGPEDYVRVEDIFYNPGEKTIVACEAFKNLFISYRLDGEFAGKEKPDYSITGMESIERASDGALLIANQLESRTPEECAFTFVKAQGTTMDIDPFLPVHVEGYSAVWAKKPMSVCGNKFRFVKFLTDTVFSIEKGVVHPTYKLDFGKSMLSKQYVGEMGSFGSEYRIHCLENNILSHISRMYETDRYLALFPAYDHYEGYYWIDKKEGAGYHISSSAKFDTETNDVAKGRSIIMIAGSNENEIISCFSPLYIPDSFIRACDSNKGNVVFPEDVISAIKNVDPEGNPFLIIYSN